MNGSELRAIRKRLSWTQVQMAEAVGVTSNTVARWERDERGIAEPLARFIRMIATERGASTTTRKEGRTMKRKRPSRRGGR